MANSKTPPKMEPTHTVYVAIDFINDIEEMCDCPSKSHLSIASSLHKNL